MERQDHNKYIRRCFELAKQGAGSVSPNPMVGSVIVKNGNIIGEGFHSKFGLPHAEPEAIKNCQEDLEGSTLYCNLEPCSHTDKKTPPCVPLIINSGIKKVVISNIDPNPKVSGRGIQQLRKAGIEVVDGILKEEGNYLNRFFFKYIKAHKPYVTLKIAQSIDNFISKSSNEQTWLTGKDSQKYVHQLRSIYDSVLVGANTIKVDNPLLNVRLVEGRDPKIIILDGNLSLPETSSIIKNGNALIATSKFSDTEKKKRLAKLGIDILEFDTDAALKINLHDMLKKIGEMGMSSILVEGGSKIFSQFISEKLFDELIILTAPVILGAGLSGFRAISETKLELHENFQIGCDQVSIYLV